MGKMLILGLMFTLGACTPLEIVEEEGWGSDLIGTPMTQREIDVIRRDCNKAVVDKIKAEILQEVTQICQTGESFDEVLRRKGVLRSNYYWDKPNPERNIRANFIEYGVQACEKIKTNGKLDGDEKIVRELLNHSFDYQKDLEACHRANHISYKKRPVIRQQPWKWKM